MDAIKDENLRKIANHVRLIIRKSIPDAEETMKMGTPCYTIGGKMIVSIADYRNHVNLYFFQGANFPPACWRGLERI